MSYSYNYNRAHGIAWAIVFTIVSIIASFWYNFSFAIEDMAALVYGQQQQQDKQQEQLRPILPQYQQQQFQTELQQRQESPTSLGVKIISPVRGESIYIGKDLVISGQSTDNGISDCVV